MTKKVWIRQFKDLSGNWVDMYPYTYYTVRKDAIASIDKHTDSFRETRVIKLEKA